MVSTSATFVTPYFDIALSANVPVLSVFGTLFSNLDTPTAVTFDFDQYADSYDRNRTLYLVTYDNNRTVHIAPEERTVYVQKLGGSNTVHIAA